MLRRKSRLPAAPPVGAAAGVAAGVSWGVAGASAAGATAGTSGMEAGFRRYSTARSEFMKAAERARSTCDLGKGWKNYKTRMTVIHESKPRMRSISMYVNSNKSLFEN